MTNTSEAPIKNPVARVLPLLDVPHLDRVFDYSVPVALADSALPGVRVQVRFHGRLVEGYIVERVAESDFGGPLAPLRRVLNQHVVYSGAFKELIEETAQYYAGTRADVLRLAVPKRVARVDKEDFTTEEPIFSETPAKVSSVLSESVLEQWRRYEYGESFLKAVEHRRVSGAWQLLPGEDLVARFADLIHLARTQAGSTLIIVPDQFDLEPLYTGLREAVGEEQVGRLAFDDGPTKRYRTWLRALYGLDDVIIGTRAAAFVPLKNLHTAIILDDVDDVYVDPRSPYPHARDVLLQRATREHANYISAGWVHSLVTQQRLETKQLNLLAPYREELRKSLPRIIAPGDSEKALERDPLARAARIPQIAFTTVRQALDRDEPVVFQVPRRGNVPSLVCQHCFEKARCRHCGGALVLPVSSTQDNEPAVPTCRLCGTREPLFTCTNCGSHKIRATVKGAVRTAEELGRAFPGVPVLLSYGDKAKRRTEVEHKSCVVVATPGSEPDVPGGYGTAVLLDSWALLNRPELSADEDTARQWWNLVRKVKPFSAGGHVVIVGDPLHPMVQGLIRGNSVAVGRRLLAERKEVGLPPYSHFIAIDGDYHAVAEFIDALNLDDTPHVTILGPMDLPAFERLPAGDYVKEPARMVVKCSSEILSDITRHIRQTVRYRSTDPQKIPVRVQVDPVHLG